jgi:hypothetical protein
LPQIIRPSVLNQVIHAPHCYFEFIFFAYYNLPILFCTNEAEHDCSLFARRAGSYQVVDRRSLQEIEKLAIKPRCTNYVGCNDEFYVYTIDPTQSTVTVSRHNFAGQAPKQHHPNEIVTKREAYKRLHQQMQRIFELGDNITPEERRMIFHYREKKDALNLGRFAEQCPASELTCDEAIAARLLGR